MKRNIIKISALLATAISSLFSFFGCKGSSREVPLEYGTPWAEFSLKARVSHRGKAIEGLQVEILDNRNHQQVAAKTSTNAQGEATLKTSIFPKEGYQYYRVTDVDGDKNGTWKDKIDSVWISSNDFSNPSGHWNQGMVEKSVTIEIAPKQAEPKIPQK